MRNAIVGAFTTGSGAFALYVGCSLCREFWFKVPFSRDWMLLAIAIVLIGLGLVVDGIFRTWERR